MPHLAQNIIKHCKPVAMQAKIHMLLSTYSVQLLKYIQLIDNLPCIHFSVQFIANNNSNNNNNSIAFPTLLDIAQSQCH